MLLKQGSLDKCKTIKCSYQLSISFSNYALLQKLYYTKLSVMDFISKQLFNLVKKSGH